MSRLKKSLQKTQSSLTQRMSHIVLKNTIDEDEIEELEEILITADMGVPITMELIDSVRAKVKASKDMTDDIYGFLRESLRTYLPDEWKETNKVKVLLVFGVNGSGKTTTIAKLAKKYKDEGRKVLLAAADTFRAAAVEQLRVWSKRLEIPMIEKADGADPSSVIYEALEGMKARGCDLLIIDTAGRLHTNKNLMDEMSKMKRTIAQHVSSSELRTQMILDATTGNNGLMQARQFDKTIGIDELILAKFDSSAKGGFIFSIARELKLPVKYLGIGEGVDDLLPFSRDDFIEALFER
ncbi:signal recognition particle-docking protein FtsY [PVC group bacterium (ex Bugula neritina AB1)]|nr:signal recognition particle-docking protein FtsY [PVC group bacterium (ex Bugula neritina AB1)]